MINSYFVMKNLGFDFSGKRVRKDGKALSKFDVAWWIEQFGKTYNDKFFTKLMDVFTYQECADKLKSLVL